MYALRKVAGLVALAVSLAVTPVAAASNITPLVSTDWLAEHIGEPDMVVLDIRSPFAGSGKKDYLAGHIPGALWSEYPGYWRTDRESVVGVLPSVEKLEAALSELGVADGKTVVIVPAGGNSALSPSSHKYIQMAADSNNVTSSMIATGILPCGCRVFSLSLRNSVRSSMYSYSRPSSANVQRQRADRE